MFASILLINMQKELPFFYAFKEKRTSLDLSQREIAEYLGVTVRAVSGWETGKSIPHGTMKRKINDLFERLEKKQMEKLPKSIQLDPSSLKPPGTVKTTENIESKVTSRSPEWLGVPMYDIPVTAGAVVQIRDEPHTEPAYYLQIPSFKNCTFGARVSGDSMYPEIRNGDYVVCQELQSLDSLIFGDIYLVITIDGMETVKYVHPHEDERDWIKLVPYNKSVPVTPMPKKNIRSVYKVKGVIKGY